MTPLKRIKGQTYHVRGMTTLVSIINPLIHPCDPPTVSCVLFSFVSTRDKAPVFQTKRTSPLSPASNTLSPAQPFDTPFACAPIRQDALMQRGFSEWHGGRFVVP